jgi:hypothetical protein
VLDDYLAALNRGDEKAPTTPAISRMCGWPAARSSSGTTGDYKLEDFKARAGDGWTTALGRAHADPCRREQGPSEGEIQPLEEGRLADRTFETIYIVTRQDGHWGIQARSSFALAVGC